MGGLYARKTVKEQIRLNKRRFPRSIFLTRGQRYSPLAAFRVRTHELESRGSSCLNDATAAATAAIAKRFGGDLVDGKIQAHIIVVER